MKRIPVMAIEMIALAMVFSTANAQNLLDDGGFDNAVSGSQTSNSAWELSVNVPNDGPSAQFQTGFANADNTGVGGAQPPGTGAGVWLRSFEGDQGGAGEPLAQATLDQSIVAPANGAYQLSFVVAKETHFLATELSVTLEGSLAGQDSVDLLAAAIPNGNLGGAASPNGGGTPFTLSLAGVTAGEALTVTMRMVDGQDALINPQSVMIDDFVLTLVVPEPSFASLFAVSGLVLARQRRRPAYAP